MVWCRRGTTTTTTGHWPAKRLCYNYLHENMQIVGSQGSPERNSRVLFTVSHSHSLCFALSDFVAAPL